MANKHSHQIDRTSSLILAAAIGYAVGIHVFAAIGLWVVMGRL